MEIAAEVVADVGGHVQIEGMAAEADQRQDELDDQDGSADGGTDDEYGSHFLIPLYQSPRHGERTRIFMMNNTSPLVNQSTPHVGRLAGHGRTMLWSSVFRRKGRVSWNESRVAGPQCGEP